MLLRLPLVHYALDLIKAHWVPLICANIPKPGSNSGLCSREVLLAFLCLRSSS